jgi:hypothetical protein
MDLSSVNTGDITHPDNIMFYQKYLEEADLVTLDSGVLNELDSR